MGELLIGPRLASDPKRTAGDLIHSRASTDDIEAFQAKRHMGPSIKDFKLDLTSKGSAAPWNALAENIFIVWFKRTRQLPAASDDEIVKRFRNYVKTISSAYKESTKKPTVLAAKAVKAKNTMRRHEVCRFVLLRGGRAASCAHCLMET